MAASKKKPKTKAGAPPKKEEPIPRLINVEGSAQRPEATEEAPTKIEEPNPQEPGAPDPEQNSSAPEVESPEHKEPISRKQSIVLLAGWIIGGLCFLGGLFALLTYPLSGVTLLLIGVIVFPPISEFVLNRWKIKIPWVLKGIAVSLLAALFVVVQLRRLQADSISRDLVSHAVVGKDTLKTGFQKETPVSADLQEQAPGDTTAASRHKYLAIGEKAVVGYFEMSIDKARVDTTLGVANVYAEQTPGSGNTFVILDVTYKCIDKESRAPRIGTLFMKVGDRMYEFNKTETVSAPGWGLYFDQLNPLTSKTTKIVYKIPRDVKGEVFWEPGGNPDSVRFYCGRI